MPSNIALIKYMGKNASESNLPSNASLSYTLEHLRSFVLIEPSVTDQDEWAPLESFPEMQLSEHGRRRFLNHFAKLKRHWGIKGSFTLRSANNFPPDCGLASSASSFAALTQATANLAQKFQPDIKIEAAALSVLSRQGSGSSCRSFFSPWAQWRVEGAEGVDLSVRLEHAVLLIEEGKKAVSSSEAHRRVPSSLLFDGRTRRAECRLKELLASLNRGDWKASFELCWAEFWDMHALFETSHPPFSYMHAETVRVLNHIRERFQEEGDGPLVTMDAGANIHLLFREQQRSDAASWFAGKKAITSWS